MPGLNHHNCHHLLTNAAAWCRWAPGGTSWARRARTRKRYAAAPARHSFTQLHSLCPTPYGGLTCIPALGEADMTWMVMHGVWACWLCSATHAASAYCCQPSKQHHTASSDLPGPCQFCKSCSCQKLRSSRHLIPDCARRHLQQDLGLSGRGSPLDRQATTDLPCDPGRENGGWQRDQAPQAGGRRPGAHLHPPPCRRAASAAAPETQWPQGQPPAADMMSTTSDILSFPVILSTLVVFVCLVGGVHVTSSTSM